jgi:hypothetical protein
MVCPRSIKLEHVLSSGHYQRIRLPGSSPEPMNSLTTRLGYVPFRYYYVAVITT